MKWTAEQKLAITSRRADVLVTASAGTGKTMVLSGRCVEAVANAAVRADVGQMLVLTFTNAAAGEMHRRIARQLKAQFDFSRNDHVRRQLCLLDAADIGTIHSFCRKLIWRYFYKIGADPTLKVIDPDEQRLLKAEVLDRTIDWAWEQGNLRQGLEHLFYRRNVGPGGFHKKIIEISEFLDGLVHCEDWYQRASAFADEAVPMDLQEEQKTMLLERFCRIRDSLAGVCELERKLLNSTAWSQIVKSGISNVVQDCIDLAEAGDINAIREKISDFKAPRLAKSPGTDATEIIREQIKAAEKSLRGLLELAVLNPDYLQAAAASEGISVKILIQLVRKFGELYHQAKTEAGCVDFADLERYALKILTDKNGQASQAALDLRSRYKYIFVDEYQDINFVQQRLLELLGEHNNVFAVGDVKQSIYGFRQARPEIFIQQLKKASADPGDGRGALRVDLSSNFRSRRPVLDFVNALFRRIMTESACGISYDDRAALKAGFEYKDQTQDSNKTEAFVEINLLDEEQALENGDNEQTEEPDEEQDKAVSADIAGTAQREASIIAERIQRMVGRGRGKAEFQVYDKDDDRYRDVQYKDIVILLRSLAHKTGEYTEILRLAGVPVRSQSGAGYFDATEICDCISLLKVLDNPQRDIELAAVLRSPFFKVSDSELVKITATAIATGGNGCFYDRLMRYCESGPDVVLRAKAAAAVEQIERWRILARRGNLADLVWGICRYGGYLSFVAAMPNGRQRKANLLKLHDRAIQFEGFATSARRVSLRRFVEFIEKLIEQDTDWAQAEPPGEADNSVRLMSIHKSKGLEFPVVFLAGLGSRFNMADTRTECLLDKDCTMGLRLVEKNFNSRVESFKYQLIREKKRKATIAEEMRILYVALTRARERLVLSGVITSRKCRRILQVGALMGGGYVPGWILQSSMSPVEWILYAFADNKTLQRAFDADPLENTAEQSLFSLYCHSREKLDRISCDILQYKKTGNIFEKCDAVSAGAADQLFSKVCKMLNWRYPFSEAAGHRAKESVTSLTHRNDEFYQRNFYGSIRRRPKVLMGRQGSFGERAEAMETGAATHIVIQRLDISKAATKEHIAQTIEKLAAEGAIVPRVSGQVDIDSIQRFFHSDLGKIVLRNASSLQREWTFTYARPVGADRQIIQGIIDMLIETPDGLIVIDFKTDRVNEQNIHERAESYFEQIRLYGRAAELILKKPFVSGWLYFLSPSIAIKVV
ncbi:MAG: helicase-exonuclease AddAB subunit AddA [Planctomycetota bacterium]